MENLMRGTKQVELSGSEPFGRPGLDSSVTGHFPPIPTVDVLTYREYDSAGCIQRKLYQIPLHSHVIEHVLGTV